MGIYQRHFGPEEWVTKGPHCLTLWGFCLFCSNHLLLIVAVVSARPDLVGTFENAALPLLGPPQHPATHTQGSLGLSGPTVVRENNSKC